MTLRAPTLTQKVRTAFGTMFLHIEFDPRGYPIGGSISHPGKEPTSQIAGLIEALSEGLNIALGPEHD